VREIEDIFNVRTYSFAYINKLGNRSAFCHSGGIHSKKGKSCEAVEQKISRIVGVLEREESNLFPESISVANFPYSPDRVPRANGGWGDLRDHSLCLNFSSKFTHL